VTLPHVPAACQQAYHLFYLVLPSLAERQALIQHLNDRGVSAVFHYLPLHLSKMGRSFGGRPGDCPVTEHISDRLLRLPFYNDLSADEQAGVIEDIKAFSIPAQSESPARAVRA
jgi:dTDP-4-amino-4,6-dideoxygalactose transaminase